MLLKSLLLSLVLVCPNVSSAASDQTYNTYYGTTEHGGSYGFGSVFMANGKHIETLYSFCSEGLPCGADGYHPLGNVVQLPDGSLVGTTSKGGGGLSGTIFHLTPSLTASSWQFTKIWDVCWWSNTCDRQGSPRGSLTIVGTYQGVPVIEGLCEAKDGRGVLYDLYVSDAGNAIIPVKWWGKNTGL